MGQLNTQQQSAVYCNDHRILCLAGAGTGKTTTMLSRISHLVKLGIDPSSILVLTFTNAAAFEMKDRYKRLHSVSKMPEFRTFHSFCYLLLSSDESIRRELGYFSTPSIADPAIRKRIIQEAGTITNIKSSIESLSKKKTLTTKERYEYDLLVKTEQKLMKKKNTITFDALSRSICELFSSNSPIVEPYKEKYKYIFVDEFQDTDVTQYKFIESFTNSDIFVVGDALQAIYGFRGADSSIIKKLSTNPEWTTIKLTENYRSSKNICMFANQHSGHANASFRVPIYSEKTGEDVICISNDNFISFGSVDIDTSRYCIKDAVTREGSTAILCRTNSEVRYIQQDLEKANIVYRSGKHYVDVENVLNSVGDNEHLIDWLSSFLNSDRYADYIRASTLATSQGRTYTVIDFLHDFGNSSSIASRWDLVKCIRRICKEKHRSVFDRCRDILSVIECDYIELDENRCVDMKSAIQYIHELFTSKDDKPGTDIYVGTIHSVKGLEFDNVYVVGVKGPNFQLKNEENLNLYYVAITRAKNHLVVFEKEGFYEN